MNRCGRILGGLFLSTCALALFNPLQSGFADDGKAQNCFGPTPYNCYSIGDIDPTILLGDYDEVYAAYARFAWQDFLALNFPAASDANGDPIPEPSSTNGLDYNGGEYVTVWETYMEARDMFQEDGAAPPAFGSGHQLPDACRILQKKLGRHDVKLLLHRVGKSDSAVSTGADVLDEYIQANRMGPVIDQNGWYLRFAINFNEPIYDYVVDNALYNQQGQEAFDANDPYRNKAPVQWPRGSYTTAVQEDDIGAIMVKASWKLLGPTDDVTRFHRVPAWIYNKAGGAFGQEPTVPESCRLAEVGLLGFHIVHRTDSAPQWIWSTFEHVDNAPWMADFQVAEPMTGTYSLFDLDTCPPKNGKPSCAYNQLPPHPWNPDRSYAEPTQVVRIAAPGKQAIEANIAYRDLLREGYGTGNTVWENYFLVDVQFPTVTSPGTGNERNVNEAYPDGLPTPTFLANSTLETYIQGFTSGDVTTNGNDVPLEDTMQNINQSNHPAFVSPWSPTIYNKSGGAQRNTSSCIACHADAGLTNGTFSTYVFSMSRAQPVPDTSLKANMRSDLVNHLLSGD